MLWHESRALGYPLTIAAYMGQLKTVKIIFRCMDVHNVTPKQQEAFTLAMSASLSRGHTHVSKYLASVHAEYSTAVRITDDYLTFTYIDGTPLKNKNGYGDWLAQAIKSQDVELVRAILSLKHEGGVEVYVEGLRKACKSEVPVPGIVRLFFEMKLLNINQHIGLDGYHPWVHTRSHHSQTPLMIAVKSRSLWAIHEMLALGARIAVSGLVDYMKAHRGSIDGQIRHMFEWTGQAYTKN
jgi:hypothetical protein